MDAAPTSPSPNVSEDGSDDDHEMDTDDEEGLLAYNGQECYSDCSRDSFEHV